MFVHLAAPSCVLPLRVGPNCQALADQVCQVALMLLETKGCLAYDHQDLPPDLPTLGLTYHAHLPLDLPWDQGADYVLNSIQALKQKIAFLQPQAYVLHPPPSGFLSWLATKDPLLLRQLCLENIKNNDLSQLWDEILALDLGVCLDLGHLISYGQERILDFPGFFHQLRMLHVYGGETDQGHLSLEALPDPLVLRDILRAMHHDCVLVVEIFNWDQLCSSLTLLRTWLDQWGFEHD